MIAVIAVALLIVSGVIMYAVFHKLVVSKTKKKERFVSFLIFFLPTCKCFRELQDKVDQFAQREKERNEKQLLESPVTFPDPDEP